MVSGRTVRDARIVLGARAGAPGALRADAALCRPGSLDAGAVGGAIVVCSRGAIGRVDKSAAVHQAGGAGMVLTNVRAGAVTADLHAVPTVHLDRAAGRRLTSYLARHPRARATLRSTGTDAAPVRVVRWSSGGDPASALVKPDLVAPALGRLGAVPPRTDGSRFAFFSGTSAATAHVSGVAALLRARSRLVGPGHPLGPGHQRAPPRRAGAAPGRGPQQHRLRAALAPRPRGRPARLPPVPRRRPGAGAARTPRRSCSTPTASSPGGSPTSGVGRCTSPRRRAASPDHDVRVGPAALRIPAGGSATFTVSVTGPGSVTPLDDGYVVWRGADGTRLRIPVVLSR